MIPMNITQIAAATGGHVIGNTSAVVNAVCTDSRKVTPGTLFVAIAGEHVDGHQFIPAAAQLGATAALVDHAIENTTIAQIVVKDTVKALGLVARAAIRARREKAQNGAEPFTVIAVTGSVGKTTTKDLLNAILSTQAPTIAPVGSFNNEIGLPLTACRVDEKTRYLVAEMGASATGEIAYLASLVPPDIAIELKVGVAHLGGFGSVDNIRRAKAELVQALRPGGTAILNADDTNVMLMTNDVPASCSIRYFSANGTTTATDGTPVIAAHHITLDDQDRPAFTLITPHGETDIHLQLRGRHNVANALAAASAALTLGINLDTIARVLDTQGPASPHRMALSTPALTAPDGTPLAFTLIDDSFNANPDSMKAGLDALAAWKAPYRIAVLGPMLELGDNEDARHRDIGAYCAKLGLDAVIAVGPTPDLVRLAEQIIDGAHDAAGESAGKSIFTSRAASIDEAESIVRTLLEAHPHAVVLVKGSHASHIGELADRWSTLNVQKK